MRNTIRVHPKSRGRLKIDVSVWYPEPEPDKILYFVGCGECGHVSQYDPRTLGGDSVTCKCGKHIKVKLS